MSNESTRRQDIADALEEISSVLSRFGNESAQEVADKADLLAKVLTSRAAAAATIVRSFLNSVASRADNAVQAVGDAIAWMIRNIEHMSVKDRQSDANYHRISAVGDASEAICSKLDDIGLSEYDVRIEASIDSSTTDEDILTVEVYKPTEEGGKPAVVEPEIKN